MLPLVLLCGSICEGFFDWNQLHVTAGEKAGELQQAERDVFCRFQYLLEKDQESDC